MCKLYFKNKNSNTPTIGYNVKESLLDPNGDGAISVSKLIEYYGEGTYIILACRSTNILKYTYLARQISNYEEEEDDALQKIEELRKMWENTKQ